MHRPNSTKCQLHGRWNFSLAVHISNSNLLSSTTLKKKKKNQIHLQKKPNSAEQANKKNPCYFHQQLHRTNGEMGQSFSSLRDIWCGSTSKAERSGIGKRTEVLHLGGSLISILRLVLATKKEMLEPWSSEHVLLSTYTSVNLQAGLWNHWRKKEEIFASKHIHCIPWSLDEGGRASEGTICTTSKLALGRALASVWVAFKFGENLGKFSGVTFSLLPPARCTTYHSWARCRDPWARVTPPAPPGRWFGPKTDSVPDLISGERL